MLLTFIVLFVGDKSIVGHYLGLRKCQIDENRSRHCPGGSYGICLDVVQQFNLNVVAIG